MAWAAVSQHRGIGVEEADTARKADETDTTEERRIHGRMVECIIQTNGRG